MLLENKTKLKNNISWGLLSYLLIFAIGLVVPRFILTSYGSEVNGLLATVIQIFTYVGLLEAGIGNASLNALYKPFVEKDRYSIRNIFSATQKYFRRVTVLYILCVIAVSLIYPFFISCELSYIQVFLVILFQGLSSALTFYFIAAYKQLLLADGKNYIVTNISLVIYILTSTVKIILMGLGFDVVILQISYFFIHVGQCFLFFYYMGKKYTWLKKIDDPNMSVLSQRKAFFVHELSGVVFSSTDAFVLSTFCNLMTASVYSIYNMVFIALNSLINSVNAGLNYILGHSYNNNKEEYVKIHDLYDDLYMASVFSIFSVAYVLICPFVKMYTTGIHDTNYIDYKLPLLFVVIQLLSCGRATSARLITISGHAKATQWRSLLEAFINLIVSIVCVNFMGIYGVLVGTIVALLYRSNDIIIYANIKILKRSAWKTYFKLMSNIVIFIFVVILENKFRFILDEYCISVSRFILLGIIFMLFSIILYFGKLMLFNHTVRQFVLKKR